MNELLAGYANYASVESIIDEQANALGHAKPEMFSPVTITITYTPWFSI